MGRRRAFLVALVALVVAEGPARGDDTHGDDTSASPYVYVPPPALPPSKTTPLWKAWRAGSDLIAAAPVAATLDGAWSLVAQGMTSSIKGAWNDPLPYGLTSHLATRLLYSTSWLAMLAIESTVLVVATGGRFDWLADATYRVDWLTMLDLPTCPTIGAYGGCGIGVGTSSTIQLRPIGSRWWFEAGGGWFEQRVSNDAYRTLAESTGVLSPIAALRQFATGTHAPIALDVRIGPGVYLGMHNAHVSPTKLGAPYFSKSLTQIHPLDVGAGLGGRAELRITFFEHVILDGDLTLAPFLLGGPVSGVDPETAPLDFPREGTSVWRKASAGLGVKAASMPFVPVVSFFAAELSDRPIEKLGYRGAMMRFDVPLRVPGS